MHKYTQACVCCTWCVHVVYVCCYVWIYLCCVYMCVCVCDVCVYMSIYDYKCDSVECFESSNICNRTSMNISCKVTSTCALRVYLTGMCSECMSVCIALVS